MERKQQSKLLVVAELTREVALEKAKALAAGLDSDSDMVEDPIDEELELDLWKLRELRRLKRERDERKAYEEEEALTERRRGMTDAEIARDNARLGLERVAAGTKPVLADGEDKSMRFLQRYYHRGGFFQDEESLKATAELATRDFNLPTGMDRTVDKTTLPQVMQVKKFGMKGNTKCQRTTQHDRTIAEELRARCYRAWHVSNALVCIAVAVAVFLLSLQTRIWSIKIQQNATTIRGRAGIRSWKDEERKREEETSSRTGKSKGRERLCVRSAALTRLQLQPSFFIFMSMFNVQIYNFRFSWMS